MLWAALAYSLGIVAGVYMWRPALWWVVAGGAFMGAAAHFALRRAGFGWALALGAFFLAGALQVHLRGASTRLDTSIQPYADGRQLQITAHVMPDVRLQQGGLSEIRQSVDIETEELKTGNRSRLRWRLSSNINLRCVVVSTRRATLLRDQTSSRLRILLAYKDDHAPESWKRVLQQ